MGVAVGTELRVKLTAAWFDLENVRVALLALFPGLPRLQFLITCSKTLSSVHLESSPPFHSRLCNNKALRWSHVACRCV